MVNEYSDTCILDSHTFTIYRKNIGQGASQSNNPQCLDRTLSNALYDIDVSTQLQSNQDSRDQEYEQIDDSESLQHSFKNALYRASTEQQANHHSCDPENNSGG